MSGYEDEVPAYRTIRMTVQEGPIAAFADQEAWLARDRYPKLRGVGLAEYFYAKELETGGWELPEFGASTPQGARDSLGSYFRRHAHDAELAGDEKARRRWMTAALRMDREVVDEVRVMGERLRIIRVAHFIRLGDAGPEPPRPSDPDPGEVGEAHRLPSRNKGFVVDPYTGTGVSEGILKLDLIQSVGILRGAPPEMAEEARRAAHTHPGGVLLPAVYLICDRTDRKWQFHNPGTTHATPQAARDALARWLRVMAPFTLELTEAERTAYAEAADRLDEKRANTLTVDGHRFRVTRAERLVRIGPDGPESPRPSDFDPEPPVEVQTRQLKEQGLWREEEELSEPDERALEFKRLVEEEEARRIAAKEERRRRRRGI
jgi:hypothetical protein